MSSTPATINAFRVFKPVDGTLQKVTPKHASYMILASAASFALDLLHSKRGYEILERLAKRTLQNMAAEPGARVVSRTQDYTQEFLQSIRANFPILIINDLGAMNARTQRLNWRTSEDTKFLSLHAGTIEVNELLLRRAHDSKLAFDKQDSPSQASFLSHILRIGITLAHEICHLQTCFLLYRALAVTPAAVTYGADYTNGASGEAGRYWESRTFGGYVDMQGEKGNEPCIIVAIRRDGKDLAWVIRDDTVLMLVRDRDFSCLPFICSEEYQVRPGLVRQTGILNFLDEENIFEHCRSNDRGRPVDPSDLPLQERLRVTRGDVTKWANIIKGQDIERWTLFPRKTFRANSFELVELPI